VSRPIFSRPYGTGRAFKSNPGLTSWAKFSRPCGTEFGNSVLAHDLKPSSVRVDIEGNCGSLGFPGFPVKSCGFDQLRVVLFSENHISGAGESGEVGNSGTLGMTKGRVGFPVEIGCRDPRSQQRDLGHPSIFTDNFYRRFES
jgi:hypothetical protein